MLSTAHRNCFDSLLQSRRRVALYFAGCSTPSVSLEPSTQTDTGAWESHFYFTLCTADRPGLFVDNKGVGTLCFSERTWVAPYCSSVSGPLGPKRLGPGGPYLSTEVYVGIDCEKSNFHPKRLRSQLEGCCSLS